jgi:hypothetical protein
MALEAEHPKYMPLAPALDDRQEVAHDNLQNRSGSFLGRLLSGQPELSKTVAGYVVTTAEILRRQRWLALFRPTSEPTSLGRDPAVVTSDYRSPADLAW